MASSKVAARPLVFMTSLGSTCTVIDQNHRYSGRRAGLRIAAYGAAVLDNHVIEPVTIGRDERPVRRRLRTTAPQTVSQCAAVLMVVTLLRPAGSNGGGSNAQRTQQNKTHAGGQNCNRNRIIIEPVRP